MEKLEEVGNKKDDTSRNSIVLPSSNSCGGLVVGTGSGDRLKRDEWSEGAVSSLLDAYEDKWVLRNRAKLKGQDWEDVARYVSSRGAADSTTKSHKTQTQCKNKIESMKKRYRSESAIPRTSSSWPLYQRLDVLLRCRTRPTPPVQALHEHLVQVDNAFSIPTTTTTPTAEETPQPPALPSEIHHNLLKFNGTERMTKEDASVLGTKLLEEESDKNSMEVDSSTQDSETVKRKRKKMDKNKNRRREYGEIADSIRWLAEVVVRSDKARMDTLKEVEKMRIEAEAKRSEMDLKRTQIIANTQLQIAQMISGSNAKGIDSSLRIGRN